MKIGYLFRYRHNGKHYDTTLIILHDKEEKRRFLFDIDLNIRVADWFLLYAKHEGKAPKEDIIKYTEIANSQKIKT